MTSLTPDQRTIGRENTNAALGFSRRDFLKGAAAAPAAGAYYFGYQSSEPVKPVKAVVIGTGDEGCQAMIRYHNRDYVDYVGFCDIRPSQIKRGEKEFLAHKQYSPGDVAKLVDRSKSKYDFDYRKALADPEVVLIVIALPLWLHAPVAIEAMKAGKHVFCEKLMARTVEQCKDMVKTAHDTNRLLAIGHQRHYSVLYDNANFLIQNGHLGDVRHIRALWHRNNGQPVFAKDKDGNIQYGADGNPVVMKDESGNIVYWDSWKRPIPEDDRSIDFNKWGWKSIDELIRWRLYDRTGAGLMAELGSHQLDACSIFLGKKHPLSVQGYGGNHFYKDGRQVDDHVYTAFEFPGKDKDDRVIVTYSSINTNAFEKYGEEVMGTYGTMIIEEEKEILLYKENDRNKAQLGGRNMSVTMQTGPGGKPAAETSATWSGPSAASSLGGSATADPSRGYREELEHFAYCMRKGDPKNYHAQNEFQPRCKGEVALADAVIALTSNIAMKQGRRVNFDEKWFDWQSPETPEKALVLAKNS